MPFAKLQFKPGFVTEVTSFTNEGGWRDDDRVRFRFGFPEKIGGWSKYSLSALKGTPRSLHAWRSQDNSELMGVGTNRKFYVEEGGAYSDITPIRATTTGTATFSATNGSTTLTVTDATHGALAGDFVTFSAAVSLGGVITADVLNQEYEIATVVDTNTYTITSAVEANASDTGNGGGSTEAAYQINTGIDTVVPGTGWGAGTWGRGAWSSAASTVAGGGSVRIWKQDNFGEDLIFNIRDGSIYYWDFTNGLSARAVELSTLDANAPTVARQVLVSDRDRHVIAFGCDAFGDVTNTQDKLLIRFSDQENAADWEPTATNTAGDLIVGSGTEIVQAVETRREIIVITDASVHSMQFIGAPFTFGLTQISANTTIVGPNGAVAQGDIVYWMGRDQFYVYDGRVRTLPCTVRDYVFSDFNQTQAEKTFAAVNSSFGEVKWFYASASSDDNDRYVTYNYDQQVWYYGTLARDSWLDRGLKEYPIAGSANGYLYNHEFGTDDDGDPLSAYIESSPVDIDEGDRFVFARRLVPDIDFGRSTDQALKQATFTIKTERFPGTGYTQSVATTVADGSTQNHIRARGRSFGLRVETDGLGVAWRLGSPRLDIRPDGGR